MSKPIDENIIEGVEDNTMKKEPKIIQKVIVSMNGANFGDGDD